MPISQCKDCQNLWHLYAQATTRHIDLSGQQRIAQMQNDPEIVQRLEAEIEAAGRERDAAREEIRRHEAAVHSVRE